MLVLPILTFPHIDPVLISIGPLAVRWYALAYIVGIIAGWFYARAIIASPNYGAGRRRSRLRRSMTSSSGSRSGSFSAAASATCCSTISPLPPQHPGEIFSYGTAACRFMAASSAASSPPSLFALRRGISILSLGRRHACGRADRSVPWPAREFHQRRIVGPADRCALGHDLSQRRPDPAPSEPALRSRPRRLAALGGARRSGALGARSSGPVSSPAVLPWLRRRCASFASFSASRTRNSAFFGAA
jgi:hypothetical protein